MTEQARGHVPTRSVRARAGALLDVRRYGDALVVLQDSLGDDPHNFETHCLMAQALLGLNRLEDAERMAKKAVTLNPEHEWPRRQLAISLSRRGQKLDALAVVRESIHLAPDSPQCLSLLASTEIACGNLEAGRQVVDHLAALAPSWSTTHCLLGDLARLDKRWDSAEQHYLAGLAINPSDEAILNNLGVALRQMGGKRRLEAIRQFQAAIKLNPTDPLPQKNLYSVLRLYLLGGLSQRMLAGNSRTWGYYGNPLAGGVMLFAVLLIQMFAQLRKLIMLRTLPRELRMFYRQWERQHRNRLARIQIIVIGVVLTLTGIGLLLASKATSSAPPDAPAYLPTDSGLTIMSSSPANDATGVPRDLPQVRVTLSTAPAGTASLLLEEVVDVGQGGSYVPLVTTAGPGGISITAPLPSLKPYTEYYVDVGLPGDSNMMPLGISFTTGP